MEIKKDMELVRRVSWGSTIAGVVTVMAISLLLTTLGTSLGLSLLSPKSDDIVNGAGWAVLVWSVVSVVVSLACGGFVAGRLAAADGTIHGFLTWATSLLVASVLGFAAAGGILNMAGSAVGAATSAAGSAVKGIGNVAGNATGATTDIGQSILEKLGFNTQLSDQQIDKQVIDALRKSDIKELQPEFLQSQLKSAGEDLTKAAKNLAVNPENSDAILDDLSKKLKSRVEATSKSVDRNDVKKALTDNTSLSPEEADKAVENFIDMRDKAVQEVNERMVKLESDLNEAKAQYEELKQQAKDKADAAARAGAKIALWSFIGLLIGAIVSALAGLWGVNTHPSFKKIQA